MPNPSAGFKAMLDHADLLKKVIAAIRDLVGECTWDCTNAGMSLHAMDSSHVAMVNVVLKSDGFKYYRCPRNLNMGISLAGMAKVLKSAGENDNVIIKTTGDNCKLSFVFKKEDGGRYGEFELKLMNIDVENIVIPDTTSDSIVVMPSLEFQRIINNLREFGESLTISATEEHVQFAASGDIGNGSIRVATRGSNDNPQEDVEIQLNSPASLTFAPKYIIHFARATPLSPSVRLCLSNNSPLCVEYIMKDSGYIRFYLTPKIDEEQDED